MKFIVKPWRSNHESYIIEGPCILLISDSWDDYNYQTYFTAYYITDNSKKKSLGGIKILHSVEKNTKVIIPKEFTQLSNEYCSLGLSMDYYEKLSKLEGNICDEILKGLNDAAMFENIRQAFLTHDGFNTSLLRNGSNVLNNAKDYLKETLIKQKYTFIYRTKLDGAENFHEVDFSFYRNDGIPYRVATIIGKNGTGKTRFLADLVNDLTSDFSENQDKFDGNKPDFGMILSLSYSAFTQFSIKTAKKENGIIYQNFGALDQNNKFNTEEMLEKLKKSVKRIIEFERVEFWLDTLTEIQSIEFSNKIRELIINEHKFDSLGKLSSGQRMIFEIITNIIANIRINTLIVFDEPEIHLHPNAIAYLMKALYRVLETYDSFALLATHVPHVIQQIPSESVVVFDRIGQTAIVRRLEIESFGENLSELTTEVFETNNIFDNYKQVLKSLAKNYTYEDILKLFNNKLSLNARVYLKGCFVEGENEKAYTV